MVMELTHVTHATNGRSPRVSPLAGHEDLLASETLTRAKHLKLCRANILSPHPMNKDQTRTAVNAIYRRAGLAEPMIIWTQSPLESLFAKICVDVFSKKDRGTPWQRWGRDGCEHDNTPFRLGAVQSLLNSGWQLGGIPTGRSALDAINVYAGTDSDAFSWKEMYIHVLNRSRKLNWLERASPIAVSDIVRLKIRSHMRRDWVVDSWSHFAFNDKYFEMGGYTGYNRGVKMQQLHLRLSLLCQQNLSFEPFRLFYGITGKATPTHMQPGFFELMQHAGWVMPYENICFISERQSKINLDERGRLHCETGPAIAYSDGFSVHAWHGTIFPEEWLQIKPSASDAVYMQNGELRRVACEMLGWDTILNELEAVSIDKDNDPEIGELVEVSIRYEPQKFLRVRCGTGRNFALPVPPEMTTARQANAWTWGLGANQYKPEIRT